MTSRLKRISRFIAIFMVTAVAGKESAFAASPQRFAIAQSIKPAADGTGTVVTPNGNRIDISGGQLSIDKANLFHSFTQFGLDSRQIANFLSNPAIRNILGRVNGGNASVINGLIQVTGGNSNLFLMNPAGIVFGQNASLNVPASFTATTANGIGFGNRQWFSATGVNNYATLTGNPTGFAFTMSQPGAIANTGNLAVGKGQTLTLLGGDVLNTGRLSAPEGQVVLMAVPGESTVRLSQPGQLLSLEIQPISIITPGGSALPQWTLPIASLPALLTGGGINNATGVTVNGDGTVQLTGSGVLVQGRRGEGERGSNPQFPIPNSQSPIPNSPSSTIDVSGSMGGTVHVLGDKVSVVSANINASGTNGGGTVLIGGDYQGRGTILRAAQTFVNKDSKIAADAIAYGNGGKVIVWSDKTTTFEGAIAARGGARGGNGGFVEVSGKQSLGFHGFVNLLAPFGKTGTLLLDPNSIIIGNVDMAGDPQFIAASTLISQLDTANVSLLAGSNIDVNSAIDASGNINNNSLTLQAPTINLNASIAVRGNLDLINSAGLTAVNLGNNISLNTSAGNGNININGTIDGNYDLAVIAANGNITFAGAIGNVTPIGNLSVNSAGVTSFNNTVTGGSLATDAGGTTHLSGNVTTSGVGQTYGDAVRIDGTTVVLDTATNNGSVTFGKTVDSNGTLANNLIVNAGSGNVTFIDAVGSNKPLGYLSINSAQDVSGTTITAASLTQNASFGTTSFTGDVTTNGGGINLTANALSFSSNVNSNSFPIILSADTIKLGPSTIGGSVTLRSLTATKTIGIEDASQNLNFTNAILNSIKTPNLTIGSSTNNGGIKIGTDNPIAYNSNLNLITDGAVAVKGAIATTNGGNLTIANGGLLTIANNASLNLDGAFTQTGMGSIAVAGNITTNKANISFNSPVVLTGNVAFNTGLGTGNLTFYKTVDGGNDLLLNAGAGNINFLGAAGGGIRLANLKIDSANNVNSSATIAASTITQTAGSGTTTFNGPLDTNSAGGIKLTGNNFTINSAVTTSNGGKVAIANSGLLTLGTGASMNLNGTFSQTGTGGVAAAGSITTNKADINFFSPVSLIGNLTLNTGTGTGGIIFSNTLNGTIAGKQNLNLATGGGDIRFTNAVGNNVRLGNLRIAQANNVIAGAIAAASITQNAGTGTTNFTGDVNTNGSSGINLTAKALSFGSTVNAGIYSVALTTDTLGLGTTTTGANVTLQPLSSDKTIGIEDALANFNLTNALLNNIKAANLTIGAATNTGGIKVGTDNPISYDRNLTLVTGGTVGINKSVTTTSGSFTIDNGGLLTIATGVNLNLGGSFLQKGAGNVSTGGNITASSIQFNRDVGLTGDVSLITSNGAIAFNGTIDGVNNLNLNAGSGNITTKGTIGGNNALSSLNFNGGNISVANIGTAAAVGVSGVTNLNAAGNLTFTGNTYNANQQTYIVGAGKNFNINSGTPIAFTSNGSAIQFNNGIIKLANGSSLTINSNGGSIFLGSVLGNGTQDFSLNAGMGKVNLDAVGNLNQINNLDITASHIVAGGVVAKGNISLTADEIDLNGGTNSVTSTSGGGILLQPQTSSQAIVVGGAADSDIAPTPVTTTLDITSTDIAALKTGFSNITIGRVDGSGALAINSSTFRDSVKIQSPGGAITANGLITGTNNASIALNGKTVTFNAGITTATGGVTITNSDLLTIASGVNITLGGTFLQNGAGSVVTGGNITTNNADISFNGLVSLIDNVKFDTGTGNGNINFAQLLTGNGKNIELYAGRDIAISGAFGVGNLLINRARNVNAGAITATSITQTAGTGLTKFDGALNTAGAIDLTGNNFTFNNSVTSAGDINLTGQNVIFKDVVTTTSGGNLTIDNSSTLNLGAVVLDGGFTQKGTGDVSTAGDITTNNADIRFNSPVNLTSSISVSSGTGEIAFNSTLAAGNNSLTLTGNEIDFNSFVSGSKNLVIQPYTASRAIAIGSTLKNPKVLNLTATELNFVQDGFSQITIGKPNGSGAIAIDSSTFKDPVNIQSPAGAIAVNGKIAGIDNAAITLQGATTLNADITTTKGDINILAGGTSGVQIGNNVALQAGNINITGDINGNSSGGQALSLKAAGGNVTTSGAIGSNTALNSLNIDGKNINLANIGTTKPGVSGSTSINASNDLNFTGNTYNTNSSTYTALDFNVNSGVPTEFTSNGGNARFNGAFKLSNGSNLTINSNNGNIDLGTVRGTSGQNLTLNAGTGTLSVGDIGNLNEINAVSLTADNINFNGNITGKTALIQPFTTNRDIAIASPTPGALNLTTAALDKFQSGFSQLTIGRADGSGNINISNPVTFQDPVKIQSPAGAIAVNGLITGKDDAAIQLNSANTNLNAGITTTNGVTITNNGMLNIASGANLNLGGSFKVDGTGKVMTSGNITSSNIEFNNPVTLTDNIALNSQGITFNSTVDGTKNLTLNALSGNIAFNGAVGTTTRLGDLIINSANNITTGSIKANSLTQGTPVKPTTGTSNYGMLDTTGDINLNGNIFNLNGTINSTGGGVNIINSGNLAIAPNANVTSTGDFSANGTGKVAAAGSITASNIKFSTPVQLTGDLILNTKNNNGAITFNSTLDGTNPSKQNLTLDAGVGNITFKDIVGGNTPLGSLTINSAKDVTAANAIAAASLTQTAGEGITKLEAVNTTAEAGINLSGNIFNFNGAVNTTGGGGVTVNKATNISFGNAVNVTGDINLNASEIDFNGGKNSVTGDGNVTLQPVIANQAIAIGGLTDTGIETLDISQTDLAALRDGFKSLTIGRDNGNGVVTILNPLTFSDPVKIQSPLPTGVINLDGEITALGNATITLNAATTNLNANITTPGTDITIGNNVWLRRDVTLSTSGGDIIFTGPLNGYYQLTLASGAGKAYFQSDIGNLERLVSLVIGDGLSDLVIGGKFANLVGDDSSVFRRVIVNADRTSLSGKLTTLKGDIIFNSAVTLTGDTILNAGTLSPGNIIFASTLDSAVGKASNLTMLAANGNIAFNGTVGAGAGKELGAIVIQKAINVTAASTIAAASFQQLAGSGTTALQGDITTTGKAGVEVAATDIQVRGNINSNGGGVNLTANNAIATSNIISKGGEINISSSKGDINTSSGTLDTSAIGTGGAIAITTPQGSVQTGNLISSGKAGGGDVSISALNSIASGNINTSSDAGMGGAIALTSKTGAIASLMPKAIASGNLTTFGSTEGGAVTISTTGNTIKAGNIDSSSLLGKGGAVTIANSEADSRVVPQNDIVVRSINAEGGKTGTGGKVEITSDRFFRVTDTFNNQTSISNAGGVGNSPLIIRHGGGTVYTPFIVGDPTQNGTRGTIISGSSNEIAPTKSFTTYHRQGNISILPRIPGQNLLPSQQLTQTPIVNPLPSVTIENLEDNFSSQVSKHLGITSNSITKPGEASALLRKIEQQTGTKSAFIYATFTSDSLANNDNNRLELRLITGNNNKTIFKSVVGTTKKEVLKVVEKFRREVSVPNNRRTYLTAAKQLHKWLIEPIEADLKSQGIQNLVFIMDAGLRSLPIAAIHNGSSFLVERYSLGMMPSLSLTDTSYTDIRNAEVLAMGSDKFKGGNSLRSVPAELAMITGGASSKFFLNDKFTLENLKSQRSAKPYKIIHLATHSEFNSGDLGNSYIQLWDKQLRLDDLRQMGWNKPPVELLVLSACQSALGSEQAELGFAGFAVQAGVKSALASLWYVSDEGTLGLMTEFYKELKQAPIKAEALRRSQIAMLKGQVRLEGDNLYTPSGKITLPSQGKLVNKDFSHPYYWAAFTMIGSPW